MLFRKIQSRITKTETAAIFEELKAYIADNYVDERTEEARPIGKEERRPQRPAAIMRPERERRGEEVFFNACLPFEAHSASPGAYAASIEEILSQSEKTFSEYLLELLKERDGKDSEVYKRAEISRQLFSKILRSKDYRPTKDTAVQLAIGLELDLPQTQKLLEKAGYLLTRSSKTDLAVQYFIERKIYNVSLINEALDDCGLPPLRTGLGI